MNFTTRLYRVYGFGHLMTMRTDTRFGMQLLTCSFMPSEGKNVPYLLIDIMLMEKKRMIFVEYYDCTKKQAPQPLLDRICRKYAGLPDHMEKPAWYIPERADYSLIKDVPRDLKKTTLAHVAVDSVRAYKAAAFSASSEDNDLSGLIEFRQRMIDEGNPSSAILQKTFGKEGYELFSTHVSCQRTVQSNAHAVIQHLSCNLQSCKKTLHNRISCHAAFFIFRGVIYHLLSQPS